MDASYNSVQRPGVRIHESAYVHDEASVGEGSAIWHFCHVMKGAQIGERCSLGQNVLIAAGVQLGSNVKIQNNVAVYTGTKVEDDVFLGPSCVLTNVSNPRSQVSRQSLYEETLIRRGATVGANATIVCGVTLGRYCFVAAGAVVTKDVPDYAMIVGVPGVQRGWMSRHGHPLDFGKGDEAVCPESQYRYRKTEAGVSCLDLGEDQTLPEDLAVGETPYRRYRRS